MGFQLNIWSAIFLISIAQGLFLVLLLLRYPWGNNTGKILLSLLLGVFIVTNTDYFFIAARIYTVFPYIFGISNGMMVLVGPVLFLYALSRSNNSFRFRWVHLLHILPYLVTQLINLPLLAMPFHQKISFINTFIGSQLALPLFWVLYFAAQTLHLAIYLVASYKAQQRLTKGADRWQAQLTATMAVYGLTVACLLVFTAIEKRFSLYANYAYTLTMSGATYFLAYTVLLNAKSIFAGYKKPTGQTALSEEEKARLLVQLDLLMREKKPFLNPEYRLQHFANDLGVQKHLLSQFINSGLGLTFFDFINKQRIEEFKNRFGKSEYSHLNIYGLAMEVGFNSKSSFNTAFKKHTGHTPTEYKKALEK